jgi:hypothetical protein
MVAKSPWKTHRYLKFDPSGLGQTYRDQTTGAELPVFAVFNLEGRRELRADIGMDRTTVFDASLNPNAVSDSALECFGAQSLHDCDTPVCRGKRPEDILGSCENVIFIRNCRYKPEGDGRPVKGKHRPKELNYVISR